MPVIPGRGKNRWRVKIWHKGRWKEKVVKGSKAEAEAFEARERVRLELGKGTTDLRIVPDFERFSSDHYRPHAELHLRKSTWSNRRYSLVTLNVHFGRTKLTEFTTQAIEDYTAARLAEGMKPATINTELTALQAVLAYAKKRKIPVAADLTIQRLPEVGSGRVKFWTAQQVDALLTSTARTAPELVDIVLFIANTGVRKGEALALEWSRVDLKRKMILIEPSEEWQPKDNLPREIPIGRALFAMLKKRARWGGRWVFPSSTGERFAFWPKLQFNRARRLACHASKCALLAPPETGGRLPGGAPKKKTKRARCTCAAVGLRGSPHTLRHTYATHFLAAVPDLHLLAKILGHSHARTTKLYAHLLPDHLARGRDAVAFIMKGTKR